MVYKCCVPNCKSSNKVFVYHRFPIDDDVYEEWLKRLNIQSLFKMDKERVYAIRRICTIHFIEHCRFPYLNNRSTLKQRSLPTMFLPNFHEAPTIENSILSFTSQPVFRNISNTEVLSIQIKKKESVTKN